MKVANCVHRPQRSPASSNAICPRFNSILLGSFQGISFLLLLGIQVAPSSCHLVSGQHGRNAARCASSPINLSFNSPTFILVLTSSRRSGGFLLFSRRVFRQNSGRCSPICINHAEEQIRCSATNILLGQEVLIPWRGHAS